MSENKLDKLDFGEFIKYGKVFVGILIAAAPLIPVYYKVFTNESDISDLEKDFKNEFSAWQSTSNNRYEQALQLGKKLQDEIEDNEDKIQQLLIEQARLQQHNKDLQRTIDRLED